MPEERTPFLVSPFGRRDHKSLSESARIGQTTARLQFSRLRRSILSDVCFVNAFTFVLLILGDQAQPAVSTATSASAVITSGDRVKIGTSRDVIQVQGLSLSATQVVLPSTPASQDKKQELPAQPPKSRTVEQPKPISQPF
jgi:hypothetical protein